MQVGERDRLFGDGPIARKGGELIQHFGLLLPQQFEPRRPLGDQRRLGSVWFRYGLQFEQRGAQLFDPAAQIGRSAEHLRGFVTAARKLARQGRLGLRKAGALEQLAGGEQIARCAGIAATLVDQQPEIGRQQAAQRRHGPAIGIGDDRAVQRQRLVTATAARIKPSQLRTGGAQRR